MPPSRRPPTISTTTTPPLPIPPPPAPFARVRCRACPAYPRPDAAGRTCTVIMCADVLVYNLDQWRSSDSSTDINITLFDFKEGHMTLLSHALHWAPSTCSETWSGRCSLLFCRAARRRDCVQGASTIIKYDIAREDAVRFRHLTAAQGSRASETSERVSWCNGRRCETMGNATSGSRR